MWFSGFNTLLIWASKTVPAIFDSRLCLPEGFPGHPICQQMGHEQGFALSCLLCSQPGAQRCTDPWATRCVLVRLGTVSPSEMGNLPSRQENNGHPGWNSAGCHLQELTEKLGLRHTRKMLRLVLSTAVCCSYRYARDKCVFYHFGYVKRRDKQVLSVPVYSSSLCTRIMQFVVWCMMLFHLPETK